MSNNFRPFQILYQQVRQYDPKLYQALDAISQNIQDLQSTGDNTTGVLLSSSFFNYTISANTVIASPITPTIGTLLCLLIVQNATGGWLVTFDPTFGTVPDLGAALPLTYCTLIFVGFASRWWLVSSVLNQAQ